MGSNARVVVENYLRAKKADNERARIWPSENVVVDRLLELGDHLYGVYDELLSALPAGRKWRADCSKDRWEIVVDSIVSTAALDTPEKIKVVRDAIKDAKTLSSDIEKKARELADLMRQRSRLLSSNGLGKAPWDSCPTDLMVAAAQLAGSDKDNVFGDHVPYLYREHVHPAIEELSIRYDLKYWPRTSDIVEAIAEAQVKAEIEPACEATRNALLSREASVRDFMRAMDVALAPASHQAVGMEFSHAAYAALINACLGLDEAIDAASVKVYRSQQRKRQGNNLD